MTRADAPDVPPPRSLWRNEIVWLLIAIVAMVVGGNAVMIWIALKAEPDLVRADYYEASKTYDSDQAVRFASDRLGWRVGDVEALREHGRIALRIADAQGRPVSGLTGGIGAYRPSDERLDQSLRVSEDAAEPGLYHAEFPRPASGLWRLTLDLRQGERRLYQDLSLATP
jgi:nitrogen fixation protein FixH